MDALIWAGITLAAALAAVWMWRRGRRWTCAGAGLVAALAAPIALRNLPDAVVVAVLVTVLVGIAVGTAWPWLRAVRPARTRGRSR